MNCSSGIDAAARRVALVIEVNTTLLIKSQANAMADKLMRKK